MIGEVVRARARMVVAARLFRTRASLLEMARGRLHQTRPEEEVEFGVLRCLLCRRPNC